MNVIFSHIVAISENRCIGKDGKLLWHIPQDLKRFKTLTLNHSVIMGSKTWESLPIKPLPQRENIVISSHMNNNKNYKDLVIFSNISDAIKYCQIPSSQWNRNEVFIIGGGQIYAQTIHLVKKIYLTLVHKHVDGDVFYPSIPSDFIEIQREKNTYLDLEFSFITYQKL